MKKTSQILLIISILLSLKLTAQTEFKRIHSTLMKYIEGTANGNPDKLREAFQKDFKLFLIDGDSLKTLDGAGYINRVEKGKKYNRIGRIVSIDYENDAASAKIEVYFPERKKIATDYLLLLKIKGQWKIIHKLINLKNYKEINDLVSTEKMGIDDINQTLTHYIEGTANSEPKRLKRAFHKDFNLYYVKNDTLSVIPGRKYIGNFKKGKKNNRIGKVLSLDHENNAGLGKIQVLMPGRNRIAIDYLLLLKIKGEWKIIHKSFTSKSYEN